MSRAKEISRDTLILSISQYASQAANVLKGFLLAKYLGPYYLGVWGIVTLIQKYVPHFSLGTIHAMNREVPFFLAREERGRVRAMEETTRTFVLGISLLVCIGMLAYSVLNAAQLSADVLLGLRVIAITVILQQLHGFYFGYLRAHRRFVLLGIARVAGAVLGLLVVVVLASRYKVGAAYASLIVVYAVPLAVILLKDKGRLRLRLHPEVMRPLFALGISLLVYNLAALLYKTADRWLILKMLTTDDMGYYHFAIKIVEATIMISSAFSRVLYPRMMGIYGARGKMEDLRQIVYTSSSLVSLVAPFALVSAFYVVQFIVRFYLPEYEPSMAAFTVLILGVFCALAGVGVGTFLLAVNKQNQMVLVLGVVLGVKVAVGFGLVQAGYGLVGIAIGTVVGYLISSVWYIAWTFGHFTGSRRVVLGRILRLYGPLPMMLVAFGLSHRLGAMLIQGTSMLDQIGQVILRLIAFYLLFGVPAYVMGSRDRHLSPYLARGWQFLRQRVGGAVGPT